MSQQQQWEDTHAWEPCHTVPYWVRKKYPSMDFKRNDHYMLKGDTYHYRVFEGMRVERSRIGRKGLIGRGVTNPDKPRKKFLKIF